MVVDDRDDLLPFLVFMARVSREHLQNSQLVKPYPSPLRSTSSHRPLSGLPAGVWTAWRSTTPVPLETWPPPLWPRQRGEWGCRQRLVPVCHGINLIRQRLERTIAPPAERLHCHP